MTFLAVPLKMSQYFPKGYSIAEIGPNQTITVGYKARNAGTAEQSAHAETGMAAITSEGVLHVLHQRHILSLDFPQ